jgi:hypothetical protein
MCTQSFYDGEYDTNVVVSELMNKLHTNSLYDVFEITYEKYHNTVPEKTCLTWGINHYQKDGELPSYVMSYYCRVVLGLEDRIVEVLQMH